MRTKFDVGIATPWEALVVFDMTIFLITLLKTVKERSRAVVRASETMELVFRDGEHPRWFHESSLLTLPTSQEPSILRT